MVTVRKAGGGGRPAEASGPKLLLNGKAALLALAQEHSWTQDSVTVWINKVPGERCSHGPR